jgi:hypothetical protein
MYVFVQRIEKASARLARLEEEQAALRQELSDLRALVSWAHTCSVGDARTGIRCLHCQLVRSGRYQRPAPCSLSSCTGGNVLGQLVPGPDCVLVQHRGSLRHLHHRPAVPCMWGSPAMPEAQAITHSIQLLMS